MTAQTRAAALMAAGKLTVARQVAAVEAGWLTADQVSAAARTAITNAATIRTQAQTAMAGNKAFLAIASPTAAQVAAQVKALTRQNQALIRLALKMLDGVD